MSAAMHDAVMIVCGGLMQVPAVDAAHRLGLKAIVTDANPSAPAMMVADEANAVDIFDVPGHLALVEDLRRRYNLRGIFTEGADVEVTVAACANYAGLPGISVTSALNTKIKSRTRACLERAGIANPRWAKVATPGEAHEAARRIGYPLMVKAMDNSASRGTARIDEEGQLDGAFAEAMTNSATKQVLLEEFLSGDEQSVELLFDEKGHCHRLNIVDRPFEREGGYAIELGHVNPSRLPADHQDALFALAERAAAACGVAFNAFKADTMWTKDGPRILECTARLSGGFDCQYTTPLSSGRDFIEGSMRLAVGMPLDMGLLTHKKRHHAAAWCAFPEPGVVQSFDRAAALKAPGVKEVLMRMEVGETIPPYKHCATRPAFVIAEGVTYDEAVANAKAGVTALAIRTR
jgi:biotin carboxylase